jgi:hypothetical protein
MRGTGFAHADIATDLYRDPKIRKLEHGSRLRLVGRYVELVLECWGRGERLSMDEACDLDRGELEADRAALRAVKLVDADGRIPAPTWAGWYGEAASRRKAGAERVAAYRARKAGRAPAPADDELEEPIGFVDLGPTPTPADADSTRAKIRAALEGRPVDDGDRRTFAERMRDAGYEA